MIICPYCFSKEYEGALFCSECGTQLITRTTSNLETIVNTNTTQVYTKTSPPTPRYEESPKASFALYLVDEEIFLPSVSQIELTLGRKTQGQGITPEIDLSAYDAYKKGVSRLHATIDFNENGTHAQIVDLNSANGTRVNGNRIPPNSEVPIHNNDIITLGKLKIQIIIS